MRSDPVIGEESLASELEMYRVSRQEMRTLGFKSFADLLMEYRVVKHRLAIEEKMIRTLLDIVIDAKDDQKEST